MSTKPNWFTKFRLQNLLTRHYQTLGFGRLVRIDRRVNQCCGICQAEDVQEEPQRSIQNSFLTQRSEQVGLQKIYDFATPAIDYGLHHEKTEALYLVQLNRRRQRQLLAVDHNFYEGRSWVA
jgi:hypothetical protein